MGTAADGGRGFKGRAAVRGEGPIGAPTRRQQLNRASCQPPPPPPARRAASPLPLRAPLFGTQPLLGGPWRGGRCGGPREMRIYMPVNMGKQWS